MSLADPEAVLEAAHAYTHRGWRVIPLRPGEKVPVQNRWQDTPPLSGADIQATFEGTQYNIGIATGAPSGFWVLDIDLDKPGTAERIRELQAGRELPRTRIIRTPGGYHYYWAMPDFNVTNSAKRLPDGVDVRGTGGQVVAPPSATAKGTYECVVPEFDELPRAPEWLEELVRPLPPAAPVDLESLPKIEDLPESEQRRIKSYTERAVQPELLRLRECREKGWGGPGWNSTTFEVACTLIEFANSPWCPLTLQDAHDVLFAQAPRDNGFTDADVEGCFASALKTVAGKGRALPVNRDRGPVYEGDPLSDPNAGISPPDPTVPPAAGAVRRAKTDLGNAERLLDLYAGHLLYVAEAHEWAVYTDGVWSIRPGAGRRYVQRMVKGLIDREAHLYDDTPGTDSKGKDLPSEREEFIKWAMAQQMSARISGAVLEASALDAFEASMEDFDTEAHLLNCANGIVDLRTGELLPHSPEHRVMLQTTVAYDPAADCPKWDAFLARVQPDPEMRDYLQEVVGYSLTGSLAEQAMFLHHGATGSNGKSVFLVVAALLAGDYSQVVPRETLLVKNGGAEHPTSVARMRGRRFLQASETGIGRRLDEETVKGLTGGEEQTARYMGKDFFEFRPTGKIHLITNHLPKISDANSIWRRMHLIKWGETITEDEQNPEMLEPSYWEPEAPGILAWAVRGEVRRFNRPRLVMPASMREDINDYRTDQDVLGEFITGRLEIDETAFTAAQDVYGAYANWAFNNGIKLPMTAPDLRKALKERGLPEKRTAKARGFKVRVLAHREVSSVL